MKTKLAPCPLCGNGKYVETLAMQSYSTGCRSCFQVKVQCFDSPEESEAAWNKLFSNSHTALQQSGITK